MHSVITRPQNTLLHLQGHLNAANASTLQERLEMAVLCDTNTALLIDMSAVESLDSAGLMALVTTLTLAQRLNKRFSLCSLSPSIQIVFELTQLDRVFEIFDSASAAQAAA
jgi:anti-sigma B factor antagonist